MLSAVLVSILYSTLTGRIFRILQYSSKCLPLSKLRLAPLRPSALIVRKLRVLVNKDQIYFFVFTLMTADIFNTTTEVKLWNCNYDVKYVSCFIYNTAVWTFLEFEKWLCMHRRSTEKTCSALEIRFCFVCFVFAFVLFCCCFPPDIHAEVGRWFDKIFTPNKE